MNNYDFIIIGAGCSGLSLLYEMNKSNILKNKTCAIFDKRKQFTKDKIWSYWNVFDHSFSDCLLNQWDKVIVKGNEEIALDCKDFTYQSVNSEKFYDKILKNVADNKNIKFFLDHSVDEISEEDGQITIKCKNEIFKANLVFDSSLKNNNTNDAKIYQHFYGCEVNFKESINLSKNPTLMDFNCNQGNWTHFFYTLPLGDKQIFIETTWISDQQNFTKEQYISEINEYVQKNLNYKKEYTLGYSEMGSIPMFHFQQKNKYKKVIKIGTAANLTRKSTGYTFLNIQKFTKELVQKLIKNQIITNNQIKSKYNFLDRIFIKVLLEEKGNMYKIFLRLFKKNNTKDIVNFLSNSSNFIQDIKIILSMPKLIFIKKLLNF
ncbi:lycopene beta cyclase [Candidatus Pelagibacterales bacterium]|jgi:lycopene beta-cyclase